MVRAVVTPTLLLAVLIQAVFGCFWRHSHDPVARKGGEAAVSAVHDHHHGHSHHHGGHHHGPPAPAHFHFGGESDPEHQHDESGEDPYSYVASRAVTPPTLDVIWIGHAALDVTATAGRPTGASGSRERGDAFGHSGWPSGQRLSLLGVLLV